MSYKDVRWDISKVYKKDMVTFQGAAYEYAVIAHTKKGKEVVCLCPTKEAAIIVSAAQGTALDTKEMGKDIVDILREKAFEYLTREFSKYKKEFGKEIVKTEAPKDISPKEEKPKKKKSLPASKKKEEGTIFKSIGF